MKVSSEKIIYKKKLRYNFYKSNEFFIFMPSLNKI